MLFNCFFLILLNSAIIAVFLSPINSDFKDYGNKYLFDKEALAVQPKIGQLVLFPSYLQHFQSLYEGDETRIVMAFNCAVYRNS